MSAFEQIEKAANEWGARNFAEADAVDPLLGIAEEVGELCHAHLKGRQGIRHTPEEVLAMKMDAVGDIMLYLFDYCRRSDEGFTVLSCLQSAWDEVQHRDWKKNPMGAGGHGA